MSQLFFYLNSGLTDQEMSNDSLKFFFRKTGIKIRFICFDGRIVFPGEKEKSNIRKVIQRKSYFGPRFVEFSFGRIENFEI